MTEDIKIGDFVMYQYPATYEETYPKIMLTIEKVADVGIENFKNNKSIILKKHRVRKIFRDGKTIDCQEYDPMRIIKEDDKGEKKHDNS